MSPVKSLRSDYLRKLVTPATVFQQAKKEVIEDPPLNAGVNDVFYNLTQNVTYPVTCFKEKYCELPYGQRP